MLWKTKHTQVLDLLRTLLQEGEWSHELPGYRVLEKQLGVGRPAIEMALVKLTEEGLLGEAVKGARRKILAKHFTGTMPPHGKSLLMIGSEPFHELGWDNRQHLANLADGARENGWRVDYDHFEFIPLQDPGTHLELLMRSHSPDRVLLVLPTQPVVRWLQARDIPLFSIGGAIDSIRNELDGASTRLTEILRIAGSHLVKKGHRRILVALPPLHQPNKAGFINSALSTWAPDHTRDEIDALIRFHKVITPAALEDDWRRWLPELEPTGVVVYSTKALLSLLGFCQKARIQVPADLSVVSGNWEPMLRWMNPEVTAVRRANQEIYRWVMSWLLSPPSKPKGLRQFVPVLVAGKTVQPPRSSRRISALPGETSSCAIIPDPGT